MAPGGKGGAGRGERKRERGLERELELALEHVAAVRFQLDCIRSGRDPAPGPGQPQPPNWAELPRDLLEKVGRAVPAGDRLWFRLVCRRWAAAGAGVAQVAKERLPRGKVTRTRGADAAASVARAEMVRHVLEGRGLKKFERGICNYAAGGGCLSVLKWARAQGYPWGTYTCRDAARNGHLAVLQWARANRCPWNKWTCEWAAYNGHLAVLQWARAQKCPWDGKTCTWAAQNGHFAVLQWARAQGCPWDEGTCTWAAENGHLAVLQWAQAQGCPWDGRSCAKRTRYADGGCSSTFWVSEFFGV